mmetsp:Transcript_99486/g.195422  ORF Transcript_99486/g.195422 Transcript_99486/m.195422 type:complete len:241 (-) Transcript_99486:412-1134(-)
MPHLRLPLRCRGGRLMPCLVAMRSISRRASVMPMRRSAIGCTMRKIKRCRSSSATFDTMCWRSLRWRSDEWCCHPSAVADCAHWGGNEPPSNSARTTPAAQTSVCNQLHWVTTLSHNNSGATYWCSLGTPWGWKPSNIVRWRRPAPPKSASLARQLPDSQSPKMRMLEGAMSRCTHQVSANSPRPRRISTLRPSNTGWVTLLGLTFRFRHSMTSRRFPSLFSMKITPRLPVGVIPSRAPR